MPTERDLLVSALRHLAGASYDRTPPYDEGSLDCVRFTYAVLKDLWPNVIPQHHAAIHLLDASKPFSPVQAAQDAGVGSRLPHTAVRGDGKLVHGPQAGCWHLCQGWKSLDPLQSGHGWFWYEPATPVLGGGLILQATNAKHPWVRPMYWQDQMDKFPHTRLAVLHLDG
jgi:hypothetical protein